MSKPLSPSMLLSIVIPYYNQPENLQDLLNSLYAQSLKQMEIIIVDDCSEKSPEQIIKAMQEKGLTIYYIRQPERRYTLQARFAGMKKASGDYLAFMDSDDKAYLPDSYEKIFQYALEKQADVIHFFTMQKNALGFDVPRPESMPFAKELAGKEIFAAWLEKGCPAHSVWNKLYAKKLYKKIIELEHSIHIFRIEDFYLNCYFLFFAESYSSCDIPVYYYKPPQGKKSLEKIAGRGEDAWQMYKKLPAVFAAYGLEEEKVQKLQKYIQTLAFLGHGNAYVHLKDKYTENLKYDDTVLDIYKKYSAAEDLIACLVLASSYNAQKTLKLYKINK